MMFPPLLRGRVRVGVDSRDSLTRKNDHEEHEEHEEHEDENSNK